MRWSVASAILPGVASYRSLPILWPVGRAQGLSTTLDPHASVSTLRRSPALVRASPMANTVFSIFAALAALAVTVLSAVKGVWPVTALFALLAAGFLARAGERYWRRD